MKYIELTQGYRAIVDDEDYERVNSHKWFFNSSGYARRNLGNKKKLYMHHYILNIKGIDHINGNKLDNRKVNLRKSTQTQNSYNHSKNKNNTSGFKGVSWHNQNNNWRAYIMVNRKFISLGSYETKKEAAHAYNLKAKEYFGEFAKINQL